LSGRPPEVDRVPVDTGVEGEVTDVSVEVLEAYAESAALEVEGVVRIIEPQDSIAGRFRGGSSRGIRLGIDPESGAVEVEIHLQLYYGKRLSEVAKEVGRKVQQALASAVKVRSVVVCVEDLALPQ
jgi:uncharacterized alkaline shock family protein YloU